VIDDQPTIARAARVPAVRRQGSLGSPEWDPTSEPVSSEPTLHFDLGFGRMALIVLGGLVVVFAVCLAVAGLLRLIFMFLH
jgi:hypothetical protein